MVKLIVGLGNPGPAYDKTRHNAGFWFVDRLASAHACVLREESRFHGRVGTIEAAEPIYLMEPLTFMNRSGLAVAAIARFYKIAPEHVLVVHDELDFEPGVVRIKRDGGHGGHNGLRDIMARLGSGKFMRLRIGIGRPVGPMAVADYVLAAPSAVDRQAIFGAIEKAAGCLPELLAGNVDQAMNRLHV
ncbi:aminoacyl-tRNA hydrolase [Methylococcus geothermalis]|uniref:Peptidyl-tRNA hydrolase n=1 Tax=Methylococcus geothermalis TaxID=2681310 RepID=A0A858QAH9_9GAMM|nr:aminoacyl-tRNA hydrolase [Methylococcus geothermalis]QJD30745.1 aminoacyl-tRNA hydrolase [Methylococcus geothermalis]